MTKAKLCCWILGVPMFFAGAVTIFGSAIVFGQAKQPEPFFLMLVSGFCLTSIGGMLIESGWGCSSPDSP